MAFLLVQSCCILTRIWIKKLVLKDTYQDVFFINTNFKCKHEEDPLAFLFAYRKVNENTSFLSV